MLPRLRFKNFNGEWLNSSLGDLTFKSGKKNKDAVKYPVYSINNKVGFLAQSEQFESLDSSSRGYDLSLYKIIEQNTFAYNPARINVGSIGYSYNLNKIIISSLYVPFKTKESLFDSFLIQYLNTSTFKNSILKYQEGGVRQYLFYENFSKIKIFIPPSIDEQQKIASFLISVDDKINLLSKKKELLEQYKKGVMQKMFSQEIRFKDDNGNDFPDWKEKKLGEIGEFKTSSVDKLIKKDEQMVSLVNYMNVYNHQSITNETTKDLMQVSANEKQIETTNLKRGDILFTPSSETPSDIGHSIVIFEDLHNTLYSYHLMRFRPTINLDILYSHYFCNIPSVLRQITRFATGSTRFTISVGSFSKIIIQLPSLKEQKKIALFLSSLDKKIGLVDSQTDKTKEFKKGLLQQMFV